MAERGNVIVSPFQVHDEDIDDKTAAANLVRKVVVFVDQGKSAYEAHLADPRGTTDPRLDLYSKAEAIFKDGTTVKYSQMLLLRAAANLEYHICRTFARQHQTKAGIAKHLIAATVAAVTRKKT